MKTIKFYEGDTNKFFSNQRNNIFSNIMKWTTIPDSGNIIADLKKSEFLDMPAIDFSSKLVKLTKQVFPPENVNSDAVEYRIKYTGSIFLLKYQPYTYSPDIPIRTLKVDTFSNEIILTIKSHPSSSYNTEEISRTYDVIKRTIEQICNYLRPDIEKYNSEVNVFIDQCIESRRIKLKGDEDLLNALK